MLAASITALVIKYVQTPAKKLSATIARSDTMLTISPLT